MKKVRLMLGMVAFAALALVSSCGDDDENIGGGGSVPVADGFYVAKVGVTPTTADGLVAEVVEADGFATQSRDGFFANYVFLTAGDYNIVNVVDQEISQTLGGTAAATGTTGSDCDLHEYLLVEEYAVDGAAISIASAGLYKVGMDIDTKEIWFLKIEKAHVIGGATTFGWSQSDDGELALEGTASATGVTFKVTDIDLKARAYKVRFDCRWSVDRRIEPTGFDPANGYVAFTNFGGTTAALAPGGSNLEIAFGNDGGYTMELAWTPDDGFELTNTNTDPIAPTPPGEYGWSIIGSATPGGWADPDTDLPLVGTPTATSATYEIASIALTEGGEFKFRSNDAWGIVLQPGDSQFGTVTGDSDFESTGGGDPNYKVKVGSAGNYKITISTTNTGEKWNLTFVKL